MDEKDLDKVKAKALSLCDCDYGKRRDGTHNLLCAAFRRPAVAAAVREAYHRSIDDMPRRAIEIDNKEIADLHAEIDQLKAKTICGVCGGEPPASGLTCICGGTGLAIDEAQHAREMIFDLERQCDQLRAQLVSYHNIFESPEYFQGPPTHELAELLTASDCNAMVTKIKELQAQLVELESKYRRRLWLNHGHTSLYGDDGEMQCAKCMADFKRESLEALEAKIAKSAHAEIERANTWHFGDSGT